MFDCYFIADLSQYMLNKEFSSKHNWTKYNEYTANQHLDINYSQRTICWSNFKSMVCPFLWTKLNHSFRSFFKFKKRLTGLKDKKKSKVLFYTER